MDSSSFTSTLRSGTPGSSAHRAAWLGPGRALIAVVLVAVVARLTVLLAFPGIFAFEQTGAIHGSEAYDTYAQNLLATGAYGRIPGEPDAAIPPLYSYVLAGLYAVFGRGYLQVGLLHTLLDAMSITLLYLIARRLLTQGAWVGVLAGLFYALYPYLIFQNLTLIDTPLFMTLLHASVLLFVLLRERSGIDRVTLVIALVAGATFGLATLTRPVLPFLALLVGVWFLLRLNLWQTMMRLLPVALLTLLTLIPWMVRNTTLYDQFVPMSLTAGTNFYQGNNPLVVPYMRAGYDVQWIGPESQQYDPYSPAGDRERLDLALDYLREQPGDIPELLFVKLAVHWSVDVFPRRNPVAGEVPPLDYQGDVTAGVGESGVLELEGVPEGDPVTAYEQPLFDRIGRLLHRFYFGSLLILAVVGVVLTRRQWRDVALLWFVQVSATLFYVLFHPSTRYRVPTDPLLFIFSAAAVVWLVSRWLSAREAKSPTDLSL